MLCSSTQSVPHKSTLGGEFGHGENTATIRHSSGARWLDRDYPKFYSPVLMRLYSGKIDIISQEVIFRLTTDGDVEVGEKAEAELDVASVLKEYLRVDRELTERAKDILEIRGLGYSQFGRTKRNLAEKKDFGLGDEAVTWIINQLLETFMQSRHFDEIFCDDATIRRKSRAVLHKHMMVDEELDQEVRQKIRNLEEGTNTWDVEYSRVLEQMKTKHGLE